MRLACCKNRPVRRLVRAALPVFLALCGVSLSDPAWAQTAPRLDAVHPGEKGAVLVWTAPAGVTGITNYDIRYIRTSADETVDGNWTVVEDAWTGGALNARVTGLANGTSYDFQVRAAASVDGTWSASVAATPVEAGPARGSAIALPLDLALPAELAGAPDVDYFRFTVTETVGIVVFSDSEIDTYGYLFDSDHTLLDVERRRQHRRQPAGLSDLGDRHPRDVLRRGQTPRRGSPRRSIHRRGQDARRHDEHQRRPGGACRRRRERHDRSGRRRRRLLPVHAEFRDGRHPSHGRSPPGHERGTSRRQRNADRSERGRLSAGFVEALPDPQEPGGRHVLRPGRRIGARVLLVPRRHGERAGNRHRRRHAPELRPDCRRQDRLDHRRRLLPDRPGPSDLGLPARRQQLGGHRRRRGRLDRRRGCGQRLRGEVPGRRGARLHRVGRAAHRHALPEDRPLRRCRHRRLRAAHVRRHVERRRRAHLYRPDRAVQRSAVRLPVAPAQHGPARRDVRRGHPGRDGVVRGKPRRRHRRGDRRQPDSRQPPGPDRQLRSREDSQLRSRRRRAVRSPDQPRHTRRGSPRRAGQRARRPGSRPSRDDLRLQPAREPRQRGRRNDPQHDDDRGVEQQLGRTGRSACERPGRGVGGRGGHRRDDRLWRQGSVLLLGGRQRRPVGQREPRRARELPRRHRRLRGQRPRPADLVLGARRPPLDLRPLGRRVLERPHNVHLRPLRLLQRHVRVGAHHLGDRRPFARRQRGPDLAGPEADPGRIRAQERRRPPRLEHRRPQVRRFGELQLQP